MTMKIEKKTVIENSGKKERLEIHDKRGRPRGKVRSNHELHAFLFKMSSGMNGNVPEEGERVMKS